LRNCRRDDLPVTERVGQEIVSLPLHSFMSMEMRERVVDGVTAFFLRNR
jgi:dTDP-4-amino-4,6-dideoxygalactose transaminase